MTSRRPLADSRLTELLSELLSEEALPPVDRWFSRHAKAKKWPISVQKELWNGLRRALARAYTALPDPITDDIQSWPGFRRTLRGKAADWALLADHEPAAVPTCRSAGIPLWLESSFRRRAELSAWDPQSTAFFLKAQENPAPTYVRFRWGSEGAALKEKWLKNGWVSPSEIDELLVLVSPQSLDSLAGDAKGLVEIQDASSQLSLRRLELRPGMRIWDVCAGQGGKTLLAASELRGKGALLATEVSETKRTALKSRVRRSGWQNIRIQEWTGESCPELGPEVASRGGFDRVIVDAPCSATGTWRRDPEGRFRLVPRSLKELNRHQSRLVELGWEALRAGGLLAYITCSWLPEENEDIVDAFRHRRQDASLVHQELLGLPSFDANTLFVSVWRKST